jgi:hypothetical protein
MTESFPPISRNEVINILRVGLQSVSPYNSQPWEVQFNDGKLLIFGRHNERGFWKHKDTIYCTLGAFLENLSEGAKHWHYLMNFTMLHNPDANLTKPFCEVTFTKTSDQADYPIDDVMTRYTNRKAYHARAVPAHILDDIRRIFESTTSKIIDMTGNKSFIGSCAKIEKVRIINQQLRDEICTNLSYDLKEVQERRRGLDIRTLELPLVARLHMYLNRNPFYRGTFGKSFLPQFFMELNTNKQLMGTPLLIAFQELVLTNPDNLVRDWMNIQKILNLLNKIGLSSHLVSSPVDLTKMKSYKWTSQEANILTRAEASIRKEMNVEISSILTLLRVGYADPCQVKSLRKDPEELFWDQRS